MAGSKSKLTKEAVVQGLIKPLDPDTTPRYIKEAIIYELTIICFMDTDELAIMASAAYWQ